MKEIETCGCAELHSLGALLSHLSPGSNFTLWPVVDEGRIDQLPTLAAVESLPVVGWLPEFSQHDKNRVVIPWFCSTLAYPAGASFTHAVVDVSTSWDVSAAEDIVGNERYVLCKWIDNDRTHVEIGTLAFGPKDGHCWLDCQAEGGAATDFDSLDVRLEDILWTYPIVAALCDPVILPRDCMRYLSG